MSDSSHPPAAATSAPSDAPAFGKRSLRKEEILAAATRLFAERGYEGASMGDLAERVGLRKASLFHHFSSKDVLYARVLGELIENVEAALHSVRDRGTFTDRLDALTDALTDVLAAQPYAARLLVREAMAWGPVMRSVFGSKVNDILTLSLELVKAGQRSGDLAADLDPRQVIVSFIGIHFIPFAVGEVVERITGTSPFDPNFVHDRKIAVRTHVRDLVLTKNR